MLTDRLCSKFRNASVLRTTGSWHAAAFSTRDGASHRAMCIALCGTELQRVSWFHRNWCSSSSSCKGVTVSAKLLLNWVTTITQLGRPRVTVCFRRRGSCELAMGETLRTSARTADSSIIRDEQSSAGTPVPLSCRIGLIICTDRACRD